MVTGWRGVSPPSTNRSPAHHHSLTPNQESDVRVLWTVGGSLYQGGNLHRYAENMQTPHGKSLEILETHLEPSCSKLCVLTTELGVQNIENDVVLQFKKYFKSTAWSLLG